MENCKIEIKNQRTEKYSDLPWNFRVDRASPIGNPFYMASEKDRDEVCDKYEKYFHEQLKTNSTFQSYANKILTALKKYKKVNLYCWCAPKRCHAKTIKKWLENQIKQQ